MPTYRNHVLLRVHDSGDFFSPWYFRAMLRAVGARPWVKAGTPGLEHRIGGLEKEDGTGNVSYDADNHQHMTELRWRKLDKIRETIPTPEVQGPESGEILIVGWGSTTGSNMSAGELMRRGGKAVANLQLCHVWPLPSGLDEIFSRYRAILVPELNMGQLVRLMRDELPGHNYVSYPKVTGKPFSTEEVLEKVNSLLES